MEYRSALLLPFALIIWMSSMAHCNLLLDDNIVDPNIIADTTGIGLVTILGVVGCPFPPPVINPNEPSLPAGVNVAFTCDAGRTVISDAVTDTEGFFKITFNTLQSSIFNPRQCDQCRIVVRSSFGGCAIFPGRRGALLAPVKCRDAIVHQLHGDHEQGDGYAVQYKAESFYYDPHY